MSSAASFPMALSSPLLVDDIPKFIPSRSDGMNGLDA
jgi:hypothetical protein